MPARPPDGRRHRLLGHCHGVAVDQVTGRVAGHQRQPVEGKALRVRSGGGPGHALGVPELDHGGAVKAGARHIQLPRDGQLYLVEASVADPRHMRVGQHHPVVINRRVAAERPAVAGHVAGVHDRCPRGSRRGGGWRVRRCDVLLGPGGARQRVDVVDEGPHVRRGNGDDPRLAAAGRVGQVRHSGVAQVAVVAGHVPVDQLARLCRRPQWRGPGEQPPHDARFPQALVVDVAVEVVGRRPQRVTRVHRRAEVPGPLAAQRDHAVGHDA